MAVLSAFSAKLLKSDTIMCVKSADLRRNGTHPPGI